MVGIYKITNNINNKVYIGQSRNIHSRLNAHKTRPFNINSNDYNKRLYVSIRKYGLENFSFEIIEECLIEELNERENYWIKYYNSNKEEYGYNQTLTEYNIVAQKISESLLEAIYKDLKENKISIKEIAEKYELHTNMITNINQGHSWFNEEYSYPIRPQKEKKHFYCQKCGTETTSKNALYCSKCSHELQRTVERPSREILKAEIRENSFVSLGKKYHVSDNSIRKWCKNYNLPTKRKDIKKYGKKEWEKI